MSDKETASRIGCYQHRSPEATDHREVTPVLRTENTAANRDEWLRTVLREATTRYNNELLDDEERMVLLDRIRRIRRRLGL